MTKLFITLALLVATQCMYSKETGWNVKKEKSGVVLDKGDAGLSMTTATPRWKRQPTETLW